MSLIIEQKENENIDSNIQFCTFKLSGRLFGVDILTVKEINAELNFTEIYHSNKSIKGYLNIRGQIYVVINANMLFGFKSSEITENSKVVIFKDEIDEPFGIIVDEINDIVEIDKNSIVERRNSNDNYQGKDRRANKALTKGVAKLKENLMVIINANGILKSVLEYNIDNNENETRINE